MLLRLFYHHCRRPLSSSTVESLATISLSGSDFFDYSTSAAATATPNQGRVVRTPQLQSEISAAVTARALSYPRRRDQSRRTTWGSDAVPPMYSQLIASTEFEAVMEDDEGELEESTHDEILTQGVDSVEKISKSSSPRRTSSLKQCIIL
jgi:hypothetical protein